MYPPGFRTPRHSHESAFFCFILQGSFTEIYRTRTHECKPHALLFHPADEPQAEQFHQSGGRCFIIEIDNFWLGRVREYATALRDSASFCEPTLISIAIRIYKEFRSMDEASHLIVEGLMLEMVGEKVRHGRRVSEPKPPRWLKEVIEFLHARFAESFKLDELAKLVGVHPVHLAQVFRKQCQCTVGEYVRNLRLEFAYQQLAKSSTPLSDIALACGFSDQSHFTRTFKHHAGMPPSQFRKLFSR
jgi:AraC family transcriptional regulator